MEARTIANANRFAGVVIGSAIEAGAENIADALHAVAQSNKEIAKSKRQIARNVLHHAHLTLSGLTKIADELERKRCTDEYYLLLEKIDVLEDKFISAGKNLKEVYDNISFTAEEKIEISPTELNLLNYLLCLEETKDWFLSLVIFYKTKKPLDLICKLLGDSHLVYVNSYTMRCGLYAQYNKTMHFYLSEYSNEFAYQNKGKYSDTKHNIIAPEAMLDYLKKKYINDNAILPQEELNRLTQLQNFFAEQNSKIDLNNLRMLYEALFNAYHDFKFSKNEA